MGVLSSINPIIPGGRKAFFARGVFYVGGCCIFRVVVVLFVVFILFYVMVAQKPGWL